MWRILNVARGKYWSSFGNTPGHVQHFSRRAVINLVESRLKIAEVGHPFPWTIVLVTNSTNAKSERLEIENKKTTKNKFSVVRESAIDIHSSRNENAILIHLIGGTFFPRIRT